MVIGLQKARCQTYEIEFRCEHGKCTKVFGSIYTDSTFVQIRIRDYPVESFTVIEARKGRYYRLDVIGTRTYLWILNDRVIFQKRYRDQPEKQVIYYCKR